MSQHDYNIANAGGAAVRADINNALAAILSQNSGTTAPTTTAPFSTWFDTTTNTLKIRNQANTAWLTLADSTGLAPIVVSVNGGQLAGMRNKIINGGMDIAQRGTSFAAAASGAYALDRWVNVNTGAGVVTISQQADVPSDNEFQNSLRVAVTTADASIAAGDVFAIQQKIEGYNARDLIGKTFTLSFWARSSKTGTHCVAFQNSVATDRSYLAEYTISSANTWEKKTITITGGLITAGNWNWTTGTGLCVSFALYSGSTYQTTAGAWQTGNFLATANQVNCLDTIGNIFAITGVQLEVGAVATPFEHRPYGTELALCQRYYWRNTQLSGSAYTQFCVGWCVNTTSGWVMVVYPVAMRATPTLNYNDLLLANSTASPAVTSFGAVGSGNLSARIVVNATGGGLSANTVCSLTANNTSAVSYLEGNAEL